MAGTGWKPYFRTQLTDTSSEDLEGAGSLRMEQTDQGPKVYRWMKYNDGPGNIACVANQFVGYFRDSGVRNSECSMQTTGTGTPKPAGIVQAAIPNGHYGWVQQVGYAVVAASLLGGTGDFRQMKVGAGAPNGAVIAVGAFTDIPVGHCLSDTGGTFYVNCM